MPRFKHYNYHQDAMVVINYQDQLQPGLRSRHPAKDHPVRLFQRNYLQLREQYQFQGIVLRYRVALHHTGPVRQRHASYRRPIK